MIGKKALIFLMLVLAHCAWAQNPDNNTPRIYHADFGADQPLPGWQKNTEGVTIKEGTLRLSVSDTGRKVARIQFGEPGWKNVELTFRARINLEHKGDRHWGVDLRAGSSHELKVFCRGEKCELLSEGEVTVFPVPLPRKMMAETDAPWTAFSIACVDGKVSVKADDVSLGEIAVPADACGMIRFYAYNMDVEIDNLSVCVLSCQNKAVDVSDPQPKADKAGKTSSPNILRNSGFEICTLDNLPDYWGCHHWGIGVESAILDHPRWERNYRTVTDHPWEGERCMMIVNEREGRPSGELLLRSCLVNTKKNKPYTLSAYMRSDRDEFPVMFGGLRGERVLVSKEWRRYTVPFVNQGTNIGQDTVNIIPLDKGTLWIDAVQLEAGNEATEYRSPDKDRTMLVFDGDVEKKIYDVPRMALPFRKASVKLDGRLDDEVWASLEPIPLNDVEGHEVRPQSKAYLWSDGTGLYIGVQSAVDERECKIKDRDGFFWYDPVVEVFLDTRYTRSIYHHFAVTKNNVQYDSYCQVPAWNAEWQSATYRPKDGTGWSAEMYLPFGALEISMENQSVWGMNIGLNENHNPVCWAPTFGGFHSPQRFAQLEIPLEVQREFFFRTPSMEALVSGKDQVEIVATVANDTKRSAQLRVEAKFGKFTGNEELTLAAGERRKVKLLTIPRTAENGAAIPVTVHVYEGDILRHSRTASVKMPELLTAYLQYTVTDLPELHLCVKHRLPPEEAALCTITAELAGKCTKTALENNRILLNIPVTAEECQDVVTVTLAAQDGTILAEKKLPFRKLASGRKGIFCDHFSRMISVEGKPFFPLGFATEATPTPAVIRHFASIGCNSITLGLVRMDERRLRAILAEAAKCGIYIRATIPGRDFEKAKQFILKYRNEPAILCWNVFDEEFSREWGQTHYAEIRDTIPRLQEFDPWHPVIINEIDPGLYFLTSKGLEFPGPIVSLDVYAWGENPNFVRYADIADTMWNVGENTRRPSWIYLLGAGYAYWARRDHTPLEHRFMAYSCMIHGITAIYYYADYPKSASALAAIKQIFHEAAELTPVLASQAESPLKISCASPHIDYTTRFFEGALYVIAVNKKSNEPVKARFALYGQTVKNVEVLFENRSIPVQDGVFEDPFESWQPHVYRIVLEPNSI